MKKRLLLSLLVLCFGYTGAFGACAPINYSAAANSSATAVPPKAAPSSPPAQTQPQPVDFGACSKFFKMDSKKLFYLTLASVNANRFEIKEIQSKSGYIIFTAAQKQFLASIISVDVKNSLLKITPCNNVYFFPVGIVQNMFKYIELNFNTPVEKLSVL